MRSHTRTLHTRASHTRAAFAAATALTLALSTAACASDDSPGTTGATDQTTSAEATGAVILDDGWAKATGTDMAGVFGTIRNPGEDDLHLTGVSGDLGGRTELHETVPGGSGMMMQEKEDGFLVPAGGELILASLAFGARQAGSLRVGAANAAPKRGPCVDGEGIGRR